MTSLLPFPDWVPLWVHLVVLLALAGVVLLFMAMPFSVFGVKTRLELIEARLDDIQAQLRYAGNGPTEALPNDQVPGARFETVRAQAAAGSPRGDQPGQPIRAEPRISRASVQPVAAPPRDRLSGTTTGTP